MGLQNHQTGKRMDKAIETASDQLIKIQRILQNLTASNNQNQILGYCDFMISVLLDIKKGNLEVDKNSLQKILNNSERFCMILEFIIVNDDGEKKIFQ